MTMRRPSAWLCGLVLCISCGDSRTVPAPTAPTLVAPAAATGPCPPCAPPGVHPLSGVVRAAGVPVAGATVGLVRPGPQSLVSYGPEEFIAFVITDGSGFYSFAQVGNVSFSGALVSVAKANYFTETKYVLMSENRHFDFDLEPAMAIAFGGVIMSPIGEARCASYGYGGGGGAMCRRFALPVGSGGTLEVLLSTTPAAPFDISVLRPDGTVGVNVSWPSTPLQVTLPVSAGTYQIDVVHIDPRTRDFELTTRLR
jgi:hypothetical protein